MATVGLNPERASILNRQASPIWRIMESHTVISISGSLPRGVAARVVAACSLLLLVGIADSDDPGSQCIQSFLGIRLCISSALLRLLLANFGVDVCVKLCVFFTGLLPLVLIGDEVVVHHAIGHGIDAKHDADHGRATLKQQ